MNDINDSKRVDAKKVLFLCIGNTCRSPMAEYLFNSITPQNEYVAFSRGLKDNNQKPISEKALTALVNYNPMLEYSRAHVSKQITEENVSDADIILTMTQENRDKLIQKIPSASNKVYTLKEYLEIKTDLDVLNPFEKSQEVYNTCRDELVELTRMLYQKLSSNSN
jgi:protein arginine phosphatase